MRYRVMIVLAAILLLIVSGLPYIPLNDFRLTVERTATEAVAAPVTISRLNLSLFPEFEASISGFVVLDGETGKVRMTAEFGHISMTILPFLSGRFEPEGFSFRDIDLHLPELKGNGEGEPVHIDKMSGKMKIEGKDIILSDWKMELYKGEAFGDARFSRRDADQQRIDGYVHAGDIQLLPLLQKFSGRKLLTGRLYSDLHFLSAGNNRAAMKKNLVVDGQVHIIKGSISGEGMDSIAVFLAGGNKTGTIPFERLSFQLQAKDQQAQTRKIEFVSKAVSARGHILIAANKALSGEIEATGLGGLVKMDFILTGTVEKPGISLAPPVKGSKKGS